MIPALGKCGSPSLTIFADAECATQTYQHQARVLSNLGLRYRVVPVAMRTGFRFHPKALLLAGPASATLLVGSGNLTFGGWRENGEVWARYDSDNDGIPALTAFRSYLHDTLKTCVDSETVTPEIEEAFDPNTRRWAASMDEPGVLLGRCGRGPAMLEEIKKVVGDAAVDELHVCAPYYDERAEALRSLAGQLGSTSTTVLVQSHRTTLLQAAAKALDSTFTLRAASFQHREGASGEERVRDALLHAKFYAVRQADLVTVFFGSANCSRAALTIPGSGGNAELMAHATMPSAEFEKVFLAELVVEDAEPVLAADAKEEAPSETGGFLQVRAARMEAGLLRVAFESDESTQLSHADIDGSVVSPIEVGMEWALFKSSGSPRMIVLVGTCHDATVRSQLHWIDDEKALRSSARGRSLAESIHSRVRIDRWGIGAWTHVLSELFQHLKYMPKVGSRRRSNARGDDGGTGGPVEFEWDDVFSDTYGLPAAIGLAPRFSHALDDRVGSLRAMLLRWYGIVQPEQEEAASAVDDDAAKPAVTPAKDEGDGGDKIAELPRVIASPELTMASDRERKKALKLVRQVAAKLGEPDFLSERQPEVLAADLKVAAVLLRVGLAAEWLTEQEFFDTTLAIWLPLFFNAAGSENTGWLEQRYLTAPDQEGFARSLRSVELSAALGCWALSVPAKATSAEHALFDLASTLGVARLPWLWQTGGNTRIAKEIAAMITTTSQGDDLDWRKLEHRWLTLIRRGFALSQLQKAVADVGFGKLRGRIKQRQVVAGELLWQEPAGFCVAIEDCERLEGQKGTVRVLQQGRGTKKYLAPFLMPVAGLLAENVLEDTAMSPRARQELLTMIEELRLRLSA